MICVFLVIDIYIPHFEPSAPGGINALVRSVIPQVIDSGDALHLGNLLSRLCVEDNQLRRVTNAIEKSMMALIEREADSRLDSCRQGFNLLALLEINHSKLGRSGKRNVSLRRRFFNLDAAGPGIGLDICDVFVAARIDDREPPGFCIAESDVKIFGSRVVAHVIGIRADWPVIDKLERVPREYLAGTVITVRDKELFEVRRIEHSLRFALSGDAENPLSHLEVDNFDGILTLSEGRHKQPSAFEIHAEMVEPPFHIPHGDFLDQLER